jgi:Xaa-Pro dipeptidase
VHPILAEEFQRRLQRAQQLMAEPPRLAASQSPVPKYDGLFLASGTSLYYFTGIRWGLSERLLGLVLPRTGQPILIVPAFEEGRLREKLRFPIEVRVWQEDESPTKLAAVALADRGIHSGRIAIEDGTPSPSSIIYGRQRRRSNASLPIR